MKRKHLILGIAAVCCGVCIVYMAITYHQVLSWKFQEMTSKRKVYLEHDNFFEDGVEGILTDLDRKLGLPDELYISNLFQMSFDETGRIRSLYTFLYGKDEEGEVRTYLVDYGTGKNNKMTVWVDGEANAYFEESMRLEPMLQILQKADVKTQVEKWGQSETYEILYYGSRSFQTEEGIQYLPGDADGDGVEKGNGEEALRSLQNGGMVTGYEMSLHIPNRDDIVPVRYMMEPEYTTQEELSAEQQTEWVEEAKREEKWSVDPEDESMYYFLDEKTGWRLKVVNAALGSRYYEMEKSWDGGHTWETVNQSPFGSNGGVAEGLVFVDEQAGFAGLTGASQSYSQIYVTKDGGNTWAPVDFPMENVAELPGIAKDLGFSIADYDYFCMPELEDGVLKVLAITEAGGQEGICFLSEDNGESWSYAGVVE